MAMKRLAMIFLCTLAPGAALAAQHDASGQIELSGSMKSLGSYDAGYISGSIYNNHTARMIHVTEITVSSSRGRRVFRTDHLVPPQTVINHVALTTGLRLDFQATGKDKDWWYWRVTRASYIDPASWILWHGVRAQSVHAERDGCYRAIEAEIERAQKESTVQVEEKDPERGTVRVRFKPPGSSSSWVVAYRCAQGASSRD
jgi:hypothetical protein